MAKKDGTVDLRIKKTQKAIKKAFFELIEKKEYDRISVKDITEKAMISRNTFYLHYSDKEALVNKICDDLMRRLFFSAGKQLRREMRKLRTDTQGVASIIKVGMAVIEQDREEYRILFSSEVGRILFQKLCATIKRMLDLVKDDIDGASDYLVEYIVFGLCGAIKYHVTHDDFNPENEAYHFSKLHFAEITNEFIRSKENGGSN